MNKRKQLFNLKFRFQVLNMEDTGSYQCCIRSTDLAYQSFVCYSTFLIVVEEMPEDGMNATAPTTTGLFASKAIKKNSVFSEAPPPPSWNVVIEDGDILNAQPENNYFLKIFEDNVTSIHCLVNEVEIKIKTVSLETEKKFCIASHLVQTELVVRTIKTDIYCSLILNSE